MLLQSELDRPRRHSLAWTMAAVAVIAADLAALRPALPMDFSAFHPRFVHLTPTFPNFGLVVMVLVLEIGLFRAITHRGSTRAFLLGFEAGGWAYVLTCSVFARRIWLLTRALFEEYLLGSQIELQSEMERFVLFAFAVSFLGRDRHRPLRRLSGAQGRGVTAGHPCPTFSKSLDSQLASDVVSRQAGAVALFVAGALDHCLKLCAQAQCHRFEVRVVDGHQGSDGMASLGQDQSLLLELAPADNRGYSITCIRKSNDR